MELRPRLHPDLAIRALAACRSREYRLWCIGRALDASGSSRVAVRDLVGALRGWQHPTTIRRVLDRGDGTWWERYTDGDREMLRLYGLTEMCRSLGVARLHKQPVFASVEAMFPLARWHGTILAAWLNGREVPTSLATLAEVAGHEPRTVARWLRRVPGLKVRRNLELAGQVPATWPIDPEWAAMGGYREHLPDGTARLVRRLPNTYLVSLPTAPWGRVRHVNQVIVAEQPRLVGAGRSGGDAVANDGFLVFVGERDGAGVWHFQERADD